MIDPNATLLLARAAALLDRPAIFPWRRRTLAREIALYLDHEARSTPGPLVAAVARSVWSGRPGVSIDPGKVSVRPHPKGFQVRGWLLVRRDEMPSDNANARHVLETMPALSRLMFTKIVVDGGTIVQVARELGIPQSRAMRALQNAIKHVMRSGS